VQTDQIQKFLPLLLRLVEVLVEREGLVVLLIMTEQMEGLVVVVVARHRGLRILQERGVQEHSDRVIMEDLKRYQDLLVTEEAGPEQSVDRQQQQEVVMVAQDLHILEQLMRVVVAEVVLVQLIQPRG
jgi:hypothetical protein